MTKKADKKEEPGTALETVPESDVLALQTGSNMAEVISENFGATALTLADLDKIKIPAAGGIHWAIPSILDDKETTTQELVGVIIAWADKKSWWAKSYADSGGGEQPDCKSNDMLHGVGNPAAYINDKEQELMDMGKAGMPIRGAAGWLCNTCPHNLFGSAAQGNGKACQDKRFLVVMLQDSVIPVLIRVPATSIQPVKQYFKRLAGGKKSYLSVLTSLSLIKANNGKQEYSQIVPKALRFLTDEETGRVRELRAPFQAALDADDAVEQSQIEKPVKEETLADMPTSNTGTDPAPAPATESATPNADAPAAGTKAEGDPF